MRHFILCNSTFERDSRQESGIAGRDRASFGYTLIELLLYITIIGVLLIATSVYTGEILNARVKTESVSEVEQQGMFAMDYISQTVRNANGINAPAAGASSASLTLHVPTTSVDPTEFNLSGSTAALLGYNVDGTVNDFGDRGKATFTKFVASASGTVSTLYARVGSPVSAAPNNLAQMAIYSGAANPTTKLAVSGDVVITGDAWTAFPIPSVSVTSGTTYWLGYNTNGAADTENNLREHTGTTNQAQFTVQVYGTWLSSYAGFSEALEYSTYAAIESYASTGALQVKEGAVSATPVPLTNNKVQVTSLSFTNLTRSGTPGAVRISFTLSRINPSNRGEYDYQKTFTTTAAIRD